MEGENVRQDKPSIDGVHHFDMLVPKEGVELFFGLVGPTGTDLDIVVRELEDQLERLGYSSVTISFSSLIGVYLRKSTEGLDEFDRVSLLMDGGTQLRERSHQGDFVGRLALAEIRSQRKKITGDARKPAERVAYILRSFKRPEEVELFRTVYGKLFNLLSVYSAKEDRLESFTQRIAKSKKKYSKEVQHEALLLVNRDEAEEQKEYGQNVRDTFPLADVFVRLGNNQALRTEIHRFVELVFAHPFLTPTRDEWAMFFAQAAALRSADLSRQVGAVVVSDEGELLVTGCNEVPKAGGGLYWATDQNVSRDVEIGQDKNSKIRRQLVEEILHRLREGKWLKDDLKGLRDDELYEMAVGDKEGIFRGGQFLDVIELGRAVHAEMAAISEAAKRGVPLKGARMFCTTFPCHLCSRHIIASGIREVVYIEPYPKSRTMMLYEDSAAVNPKSSIDAKVNFVPFVGVAPRRYFDFFKSSGSRKTRDGDAVRWGTKNRDPGVKRFNLAYLSLEQVVVTTLKEPEKSDGGAAEHGK